jgi:hypothetical protein
MQFLHLTWDKQQVKNVTAVSEKASSIAPKFEETPAAKAWAKVRPDRAMTDTFPVWYDQFTVTSIGLAGAGANLTPAAMVNGLSRLCNPCPRADPRQPLKSIGGDDRELYSDFTIVKYNDTKPDHTSPPDGQGNRPTGYWDFPENGARYITTVYQPSR